MVFDSETFKKDTVIIFCQTVMSCPLSTVYDLNSKGSQLYEILASFSCISSQNSAQILEEFGVHLLFLP